MGVQRLALTGDTTQMGLPEASRIGRWLRARTAIMDSRKQIQEWNSKVT